MTDLDPYSTAKPMLASKPTWIADTQEQLRVASYALYEAIYWNVPDTFKLTSRGTEDKPIYVPTGRTIVETINRYVAPKLNVVPDPAFGTPNDQALALQVMTDFVRRERFVSKFNSNKRFGIMRGDWAFHLYADPLRMEGSRVSVFGVDPASLFPIYNVENVDDIIGWHIVDQFIDNEGKTRIRRLTYRKTTGQGGPSPITVEDAIYDIEDWGGPGMDQEAKPLQVVRPATTLPAPIDHLPIYHVPNFQTPGMIWGSSEMRGLERIIAAVNQSISDEDIALAMDGIGVYVTNAGTPINADTGEEEDWIIGPGRVVELPSGKKFGRVNGAGSVQPYQDHIRYLHEQIDLGAGIPGLAKGRVDVSVAESGVALLLEMAPILSSAEEKDQIVTDVLTNMFFDLAKWYVAYEGSAFNSLVDVTRWVPTFGSKLPRNTTQETADLVTLAKEKIVPTSYVRQRLRTMGYEDLPDEATVLSAIAAESQVQDDITGARMDAELDSVDGTDPNETA